MMFKKKRPYKFNKRLKPGAWSIALANPIINRDQRLPLKINWLKETTSKLDCKVVFLKPEQYTPSGFEILKGGKPVNEYQWDPTSDIGMAWGFIGRHCSCAVRPKAEDIAKLRDFSLIMMEKLFADIKRQPLRYISVKQWLSTKLTWPRPKKIKYTKVLKNQFMGRQSMMGVYKATIKNGETYYTQDDLPTSGELEGQSDRYRFYVNPSENWCGMLTYIQAYIFKDLKCFGEFAHALNSKKLKRRIWKNINTIDDPENLVSFSIDGSAFDSTQHQEIIDIIDNLFWKSYRERLYQILDLIETKGGKDLGIEGDWKINKDKLVNSIIEAATQEIATIFLKMKTSDKTLLTSEEKRVYRKHYFMECRLAESRNQDPFRGLAAFYVRGTTYSGNPVRTTLGNTLRSVFYMYFYASEAGLFDPNEWKKQDTAKPQRNIWCIASGDDTVAWFPRRFIRRMEDSINKYAIDNKRLDIEHGIGQIIVEKQVSEWWDNEFCSKWFYCPPGGELADWKCTRNLEKLFCTKMMYTGDQQFMHLDPSIHASAILGGICSEVNSYIVQKVCEFRLNFIKSQSDFVETVGESKALQADALFQEWYKGRLDQQYKGNFHAAESKMMKESESDIAYEEWICERIGFDLVSLYLLVTTGKMNL